MTGKLARSLAGHDKGTCYVITGADEKYVYLADGRLKSVASPKKKSLKHIQIINTTVDEALLVKLGEQTKEADLYIRKVLKALHK